MTVFFIVAIFILGYAFITMEDSLKINKSATALCLSVILWTIYVLNAEQFVPVFNAEAFAQFVAERGIGGLSISEQINKFVVEHSILEHVAEIAEIILFLMGAMTIVELIDKHGGFNFVNSRIKTRKKRYLLWLICGMTFVLSAILDNLTTTIVMIMVLRKLISVRKLRWLFAGMVVLSANAGGAFSPIGDITTIMLWIKGNITTLPTITQVFLPSLASVLVPLIILSFSMKGSVKSSNLRSEDAIYPNITRGEKITIFCIGVGGLMFVPVFRALTGLPPFIGILGALSVLWIYTEILYRNRNRMEESIKQRVTKVLEHIDMPTILFFFGILSAVAVLQESGVLGSLAQYLDKNLHNVYLINGLIGALSSIVDNVPLVAGAMGMYPIADPAMISAAADPAYMSYFAHDGMFWQLLAYCAGVGGSMLIIGAAAGVVVMGLERISFMWYLKKISWLALIGYLAGIAVYYLQMTFLF